MEKNIKYWEFALDISLVVCLLWLAYQIMAQSDLFHSIVLFMIFGLVAALSWARLQAVDVALAEAAIGAGVTGALLLQAYKKIGNEKEQEDIGCDK
ncbi:MAG: DUF4040 domain-containing protein [Candidatus Brocadiae bacterium]|nr:DUF4040 domain-containing protein [Candidatus Brocadiia bacterium]